MKCHLEEIGVFKELLVLFLRELNTVPFKTVYSPDLMEMLSTLMDTIDMLPLIDPNVFGMEITVSPLGDTLHLTTQLSNKLHQDLDQMELPELNQDFHKSPTILFMKLVSGKNRALSISKLNLAKIISPEISFSMDQELELISMMDLEETQPLLKISFSTLVENLEITVHSIHGIDKPMSPILMYSQEENNMMN